MSDFLFDVLSQLIINTRQRTIKQKIIPLKDLNRVLNNYRNNLMSKWRYFWPQNIDKMHLI